MAVVTACYCSREDVQRAPDLKDSLITNQSIDRAIQSVSRLIEGQLHRLFYPTDTTYQWDWPNYQYAYPWRLWLDQWDIVTLTQLQSPAGTTIPLQDVILYPLNRKPGFPYTRVELDRSTTAAWGAGPTPQKSIQVTGTFGFCADTDAAGILAAAVSSTSATSVTVSDASQMGVGDLLIIDSERLLVQERYPVTTGQTNVSGATTASASDNAVTVTDATQVHLGEVLLLDSEHMLITGISGNVLTVHRAWEGSVLATHSSAATLYAYRQLTVLRGQFGTAAATHLNAAAVSRHRPPSLIRDLAIAEAVNRVAQESAGYSSTEGAGAGAISTVGAGLADLWDEVTTVYGRKARIRAV
jgi:hypothetical protein